MVQSDGTRHAPLSRLDARAKTAMLVCVSLLLFARDWLPCLVAAVIVVTAGTLSSGVGARDLWRRLRSIAWFGLVIILMNAWTVGGTVLFSLAGWYCTLEGIQAGVLLVLRLALLAAAALAFVRSTPVPHLVDAIESATARLGTVMRGASVALHLALMFGPMLVDRSRQITRAYRARGADIDTGLFARIRFAASAATPLFVSAFRSADQLAIAMQTRCYNPRRGRTPFSVMRAGAADVAAAALVIAATLVLLLWPARDA
jgi:energy-coupling factor transport system permease protein